MSTLLNFSSIIVPTLCIVTLLALTSAAGLIFRLYTSKMQEEVIQRAALQIEQAVQHLKEQPQRQHNKDERDTLSILLSTHNMIKELSGSCEINDTIKALETPSPSVRKMQDPSAVAKEIMALRDHLLLARPKKEGTPVSVEVLDIFYEELGEILSKENVTSLEEIGGRFDQNKQRVVATQVTHDPTLADIVMRTENPGYLFHSRLLRPQDIVIYKFQEVI